VAPVPWQALDLGWEKPKQPWLEIVGAVATCFPALRALNIDYAGYMAGPNEEVNIELSGFDPLLPALGRLRALRYLSIKHLGLDGSRAHTGLDTEPRTSTAGLRRLISQLPELRWLVSGNGSTLTAASAAFFKHVERERPKLMCSALPAKNDVPTVDSFHFNLKHLCICGDLRRAD